LLRGFRTFPALILLRRKRYCLKSRSVAKFSQATRRLSRPAQYSSTTYTWTVLLFITDTLYRSLKEFAPGFILCCVLLPRTVKLSLSVCPFSPFQIWDMLLAYPYFLSQSSKTLHMLCRQALHQCSKVAYKKHFHYFQGSSLHSITSLFLDRIRGCTWPCVARSFFLKVRDNRDDALCACLPKWKPLTLCLSFAFQIMYSLTNVWFLRSRHILIRCPSALVSSLILRAIYNLSWLAFSFSVSIILTWIRNAWQIKRMLLPALSKVQPSGAMSRSSLESEPLISIMPAPERYFSA